ncbi:MAG: SIS domain-containing protein [Bacteroidia bacterium]
MNNIQLHFKEAQDILQQFLSNEANFIAIENAGKLMVEAVKNGHKILSCGNGGSMCDAMHFAEELTGKYRHDRKAIPAISISDVSHIACVGNDYGYDFVFSRYLEALGNSGDVLLAISTSGNSKKVIKAKETARQKGMKIVAISGKGPRKYETFFLIIVVVAFFRG